VENDQTNDLVAIVGEVKKVSIKGTILSVGACSLDEMDQLNKMIDKFYKIADSLDDSELLGNEKFKVAMIDIIYLGVKDYNDDITKEKLRKIVTYAAFPAILKIMLDLNDFLIGMDDIKQKTKIVEEAKKKSTSS